MKSYLEQVHKALDEKFMPQQDRVPYYIEYEEAKAFFDEKLKAFVEMKKKQIKGLEVPSYPMEGEKAEEITWAARQGYQDAIRDVIEEFEGMETEEAENELGR